MKPPRRESMRRGRRQKRFSTKLAQIPPKKRKFRAGEKVKIEIRGGEK